LDCSILSIYRPVSSGCITDASLVRVKHNITISIDQSKTLLVVLFDLYAVVIQLAIMCVSLGLITGSVCQVK